MDPILIFVVIFFLLMFSAFFSGSETALTAVSRARMHQLAKDGATNAHTVGELTNDRERLIGAILLGNNLVNILASVLAGSAFATLFGEAGVFYATVVMTALVLVFAEVLPKTYAISATDSFALFVAPVLRILVSVLAPIVTSVQWVVRRTLRLFGVDIDDSEDVLSAHEELRGAIDLHLQEGGVVREDRDRLGGVLDLHDLEVSDVMVHRKNISMIDASIPPGEIVAEVLQSRHTRIPIWQDDPENIVGILHAKDLLIALGECDWQAEKLDIAKLATSPWFVPETTSLRAQLNAFLRGDGHMSIVIDEYGVLMGLLTLEDILEEIVGDISDEFDLPVVGVRPQSDGSVIVDGTVPVRDLNRATDWNLNEEEATTIAGLVIHEAQTIPDVGQVFTFYGFKFEVIRRQRNQITALRIRKIRRSASAQRETVAASA